MQIFATLVVHSADLFIEVKRLEESRMSDSLFPRSEGGAAPYT